MTPEKPELLAEIVSNAVDAYPNDIDRALDRAVARSLRLPEIKKYMDGLYRLAMLSMIHDERHKRNVVFRSEIKRVPQRRPCVGSDPAMILLTNWRIRYMIDGRTLGEIKKAEIPAIAQGEQRRGETCFGNARMLLEFQKVLKDDNDSIGKVDDRTATKILCSVWGEGGMR